MGFGAGTPLNPKDDTSSQGTQGEVEKLWVLFVLGLGQVQFTACKFKPRTKRTLTVMVMDAIARYYLKGHQNYLHFIVEETEIYRLSIGCIETCWDLRSLKP